jgi:hypothetical protein
VGAFIRAKAGTWGFAGVRFDDSAKFIEDESIIEAARESGYCEVTDSEPKKKEPIAETGTMKTTDTVAEPAEAPAPKPKKAPKPKAEKAE